MALGWILLLGPWLAPAAWAEDSPPAGVRPETISAGWYHTCGLRSDGTVACWGDNGSGQATPPAGTFTQVSAGLSHTCGLQSDGTVSCWGLNDFGQATPPAGTLTQVSAGVYYTCGLRSDGTLACWGDNYSGQATPPAGTFTQVRAGYDHTCGLRSDGTVACWGTNFSGLTTPPAGTFTQVSAGAFYHTCGLRSDGTVACWGYNGNGQAAPPAGTFTQVSAGRNHTCGVQSDGSVACWGDNTYGQNNAPPDTFTQVGAGDWNTCALQSDGTASCWGLNDFGQSSPPAGTFTQVRAGYRNSCGLRGDGTVSCWGYPGYGQNSAPAGTFIQLSMGVIHTCGLKSDGTLSCWGWNAYGQAAPPTGTFTQVSSGTRHSCGLQSDGTVDCWGDNYYGQLAAPAGTFTQVGAGGYHSCGVQSDGTLACWGWTAYGLTTPPTGTFTQVSGGANHSCAVRSTGTVACWGDNSYGQAAPPAGTFLQVSAGERHTCGVQSDGAVVCWGDDTNGALSLTLQVIQGGTGAGTIASQPAGIDCGGTCSQTFAPLTNAVVELTATPNATSTFAGWSGACTNPTGTCRLVMDADRRVTATFERITYGLTVTVTGAGAVTSSPAGIDCGADCTEPYVSGTLVTLTATPAAGYIFSGWSGACTGTGGCTVTVDATQDVGATFTPMPYTLTVTTAGSGTVTSAPAGIDCGADCTEPYANGTLVTLTAIPNAGNVFSGWSGACTGTGDCTLTIDAAKDVTATFDPINYNTLTVTTLGNGTVTSSVAGIDCGADCTEAYAAGTLVTLTATPAAGSAFAGWSGACAGTGDCTLTMGAAQGVGATFNLRPAVSAGLFHTCGVQSDGTVACWGFNGNGEATPPAGTFTQVSAGAFYHTCGLRSDGTLACWGLNDFGQATPPTGTFTQVSAGLYHTCGLQSDGTVACWGYNGSGQATPPAGTFTQVSAGANHTCGVYSDGTVACWGSNGDGVLGPTLQVGKAGNGTGTVASQPAGIDCGATCTQTFAPMTANVVTLTATPDATSTFAGWSGACSGTGTCTLTMDTGRSVTATFNRITYGLTVTAAGSGTVAGPGIACPGDCTETFDSGTPVTLSATPASGYLFSGWNGACSGTGDCTLTMDAAKDVGATFAPITYDLTVTTAGSGTVAAPGIACPADCTETYANGTAVTLTATPAAGSVFGGWTGACSGTGPCTLTMDAAKSVGATFGVSRTLTVTLAGSGTVTGPGIACGTDCTENYANGTLVTLTATPAPGSYLSAWTGACTGTGGCTVTMNAAKSVKATFKVLPALTVTLAGSGTVTGPGIDCGSDCTEAYAAGTLVTLTATPAPGSYLSGWGGACSGTGNCTVTMSAAKSVKATFKVLPALTVTVVGNGAVTGSGVNCPGDCTESYAAGTLVTLTATPAAGSVFSKWGGACSGTGNCTVTMSAARNVKATFIP